MRADRCRRILATAAVAVAAFAGLAGTAAADDPNPYVSGARGPSYEWASCTSHETIGVLGQYGAWGFYIDGCTSPRVFCPWGRLCYVSTANRIETRQHNGYRVTQNARLRVFNSAGQVRWSHDRSCAGTNSCSNYDSYAYLGGGESATSQCNGVRENRIGLASVGYNSCEVYVTYL